MALGVLQLPHSEQGQWQTLSANAKDASLPMPVEAPVMSAAEFAWQIILLVGPLVVQGCCRQRAWGCRLIGPFEAAEKDLACIMQASFMLGLQRSYSDLLHIEDSESIQWE